jgi:hypothetical protein
MSQNKLLPGDRRFSSYERERESVAICQETEALVVREQKSQLLRRFVPTEVLSHECYVSGCFVATDILSGGLFVPPNVLSLYVMSPDVLSGHGSAYIGRHVSALSCRTLPRKKEVAWHPPLLLLATPGLTRDKPLPKRLPLNHNLYLAAHDVLQLVGVL